MPIRNLLAGIVSVCVIAFLASNAWAATYNWSASATDANWNTAGNWGGTAPGATTGNTSADIAAFVVNSATYGTASNPIVIDPNRNISGMVFEGTGTNTTAYVVGSTSGNALILSNGGLIRQHEAATININAPIIFAGTTYTISS